jgi:hypothetical protein
VLKVAQLNKDKPKSGQIVHVCQKCGFATTRATLDESFYSSNNKWHSFWGKAPICKNCLTDYCIDEIGNIIPHHFQEILQMLDKAYVPALVPISLKEAKKFYDKELEENKREVRSIGAKTIGFYFKNLHLKHHDKKFQDSDRIVDFDNELITKAIVDERIILKWGSGYTDEDYEFLERTYEEWIARYECDTLAQEKMFKQLTYFEWKMRDNRKNNIDTDKLEKQFKDYLKEANVSPKNATKLDSENTKGFGSWIKDIEQNEPAEFFKDKKLYEDYDSLKSYLERFVLRPLKNLLTGSSEFDAEYRLNDDSNGGEKPND